MSETIASLGARFKKTPGKCLGAWFKNTATLYGYEAGDADFHKIDMA